ALAAADLDLAGGGLGFLDDADGGFLLDGLVEGGLGNLGVADARGAGGSLDAVLVGGGGGSGAGATGRFVGVGDAFGVLGDEAVGGEHFAGPAHVGLEGLQDAGGQLADFLDSGVDEIDGVDLDGAVGEEGVDHVEGFAGD